MAPTTTSDGEESFALDRVETQQKGSAAERQRSNVVEARNDLVGLNAAAVRRRFHPGAELFRSEVR
jgi:hypothetical protein